VRKETHNTLLCCSALDTSTPAAAGLPLQLLGLYVLHLHHRLHLSRLLQLVVLHLKNSVASNVSAAVAASSTASSPVLAATLALLLLLSFGLLRPLHHWS
jgi:hypothetical protein